MSPEQMQTAVYLDTLSVPSPGEVFSALKATAHPNWTTLGCSKAPSMSSDRAQLALMVGVLTTDGYIAIEAQDGPQVKNLGREIMELAKALGVSKNLMGRGSSLIDFAENNAWDALAEELEATENEVKRAMADQKDVHLVPLISAAAWLRGLNVVSGVALQSPQLAGASSIDQPELARYLCSRMDELQPKLKKSALVTKVRESLGNISLLLDQMHDPKANQRMIIGKIHAETTGLLNLIIPIGDPEPASSAHSTTIDSEHQHKP